MSIKFPDKSNNYFRLRTYDEKDGEITLAGVLTEMPTFGLSTNWQDAPIATMAGKVKDIFMGDLFKAVGFLGGNDEYQNQLVIGKWTAREYTGTNFAEFDLKFRIYSGSDNKLLEGSSSANLWARSLAKYAVIDSKSELSLKTLKDNISTGLSSLKNTAQWESIRLILGKEAEREDDIVAEAKGETLLKILETGGKDADGNNIPTFAEQFEVYKKEWLDSKKQAFDKKYGDVKNQLSTKNYKGSEIGVWNIGIKNKNEWANRDKNKVYQGNIQKIYIEKISDAKMKYDGPNICGNAGKPKNHQLEFDYRGINFDLYGTDSGDKWSGNCFDVEVDGAIDVGGTYQIKPEKVWEKLKDFDDEKTKDTIKEVQEYVKLLKEFYGVMMDRMNEYIRTLVTNEKAEQAWRSGDQPDPKAKDDTSLSKKLLGQFHDHDRPEKSYNKKNGMGAKMWYLDLYQNWLFQKPLVVVISDWKILPSKEISSFKGKSFYYDFTVHCLMDQIPTAGRWQYIFESTGDGGIGKMLDQHSYDSGDHKTAASQAKYNAGGVKDRGDDS